MVGGWVLVFVGFFCFVFCLFVCLLACLFAWFVCFVCFGLFCFALLGLVGLCFSFEAVSICFSGFRVVVSCFQKVLLRFCGGV